MWKREVHPQKKCFVCGTHAQYYQVEVVYRNQTRAQQWLTGSHLAQDWAESDPQPTLSKTCNPDCICFADDGFDAALVASITTGWNPLWLGNVCTYIKTTDHKRYCVWNRHFTFLLHCHMNSDKTTGCVDVPTHALLVTHLLNNLLPQKCSGRKVL